MSTLVRKGNGERRVPDEKVAEYLEMGYSVLDDGGNVVKSPVPNTVAALKAALAEKEKQLADANRTLHAANERIRALESEKDAEFAACIAQNASLTAETNISTLEETAAPAPVSGLNSRKAKK